MSPSSAGFCRISLKALQFDPAMKHRNRPPEQDDLLRPRLVDLIDMRHELVKLAALIDWEFKSGNGPVFFHQERVGRRHRRGWLPD